MPPKGIEALHKSIEIANFVPGLLRRVSNVLLQVVLLYDKSATLLCLPKQLDILASSHI